ncbi:MAG: hypothetical protein KJI70_00735 [Patescibacteria group bacterium]|nr:hypothetical protein [Patescibacteria group bacterium]
MAKQKKNTIKKIDISFVKVFEEFEAIVKKLWQEVRFKRLPTKEEFEKAIKNRKNKKRLRGLWKERKGMWGVVRLKKMVKGGLSVNKRKVEIKPIIEIPIFDYSSKDFDLKDYERRNQNLSIMVVNDKEYQQRKKLFREKYKLYRPLKQKDDSKIKIKNEERNLYLTPELSKWVLKQARWDWKPMIEDIKQIVKGFSPLNEQAGFVWVFNNFLYDIELEIPISILEPTTLLPIYPTNEKQKRYLKKIYKQIEKASPDEVIDAFFKRNFYESERTPSTEKQINLNINPRLRYLAEKYPALNLIEIAEKDWEDWLNAVKPKTQSSKTLKRYLRPPLTLIKYVELKGDLVRYYDDQEYQNKMEKEYQKFIKRKTGKERMILPRLKRIKKEKSSYQFWLEGNIPPFKD